MPAPRTSPDRRDPREVVAADAYRGGQRVWVYRGSWRAGVVVSASARAVSVRYRPDAGRDTGVDTVLAADLAARDEADPVLDGHGNR